jgi:hypothetical protein
MVLAEAMNAPVQVLYLFSYYRGFDSCGEELAKLQGAFEFEGWNTR